MDNKKFPSVARIISDFLYEEEANISRSKIISVGTLLTLATILLASNAFAKHSSHSSHKSHSSHSSGSYHRSHVSHTSHTSAQYPGTTHTNHASAATHSAHASHSSSTVQHGSHASSAFPAHTNSGVSMPITDGGSTTVPEYTPPMTEDIIDIRVPLTPPDSPLLSEIGVEHVH